MNPHLQVKKAARQRIKVSRGRLFRPFRRQIAYAGILSDTLSNVIAGLLAVLIGGLLLSNSTWQFSQFTVIRNAFVGSGEWLAKLDLIRGIVLDDETMLLADERKLPGGIYDALGEAVVQTAGYAASVPGRQVVVGFDFVFNGIEDDREFDRLAAVLSALPENMRVVLGAALNRNGIDTAYYRFDVLRDRLLKRVRAAKGDAYVDRHIFVGNVHIRKAQAVDGFQQLDGDIALGYDPLTNQAGTLYGSLPFMMYLLGEVVPIAAIGGDAFRMSRDGYLNDAGSLDAWLRDAGNQSLEQFLVGGFRYNFFSGSDLSLHPLGSFRYFPLGRIAEAFDTSGQGAAGLPAEITTRELALGLTLELSGKQAPPARTHADYFLVYRSMSLGYVQDNASQDVVVTPASRRDEFTGSLEQVSGAMTHLTALSNLIQRDSITDVPWWVELGLTVALTLASLWAALRLEFRAIMLTGLGVLVGILLVSWFLFLGGLFLAVRGPLVWALCILLGICVIRFIKTGAD